MPALFAVVRLMSPPAHLMLRGLPQRVASLELAWHAAQRQRDIHATECLYAPQCCQPARANAMAKPPAHVLAPGQPHHDPQPGWLDQQAAAALLSVGVKEGFASHSLLCAHVCVREQGMCKSYGRKLADMLHYGLRLVLWLSG